MNIKLLSISILACIFASCASQKMPETPKTPYAKGADVSWVTEMEKMGVKFYNADGQETECMQLMKSLGMDAIRLRVWVNPSDGWCNSADLLTKAIRARNLGMRIMIDFHYSDVWADPGHQTKPEAWKNLPFDELCKAVADHTTEVLTLLKANGINPEWVQVGNETTNGMLWEDGRASEHMAQYTALNNAGYDAVKSVFPQSKVIVHIDNGFDHSLYQWIFNGLKSNGGKWDIIGMSLYPKIEKWQEYNDQCISNMKDMVSTYNCEVMLCEVGMPWNQADTAYQYLYDLITRTKEINGCLGIFYWEPEAYNWREYQLGAFDLDGKPTKALDAFKF